LSQQQRDQFGATVQRLQDDTRAEKCLPLVGELSRTDQAAVDRVAIRRALVAHDLLVFRRKSIPAPIERPRVTFERSVAQDYHDGNEPVFMTTPDGKRYVQKHPFVHPFVGKNGIKDVTWYRYYQLLDKQGRPIQEKGVTIYESSRHDDKTKDVTYENKTTTTNAQGAFEDSPELSKGDVGVPDRFDITITRVVYIKDAKGNKVYLGGNTWHFKRDPGDGPYWIQQKSTMTPDFGPDKAAEEAKSMPEGP
jgi:hypothetical protein